MDIATVKRQQQHPKVLRLLLSSRLSLKSCTISFSHLCRSRTWQKQILATKTVLKVTNHSACNSMLLQKSPKYPAWWLPRYPNFHNVTILFELSCEILAQWSLHESAEKPIPVPKDPGRINVNIPGYFKIRLTLIQSSYSFMIQKNVALLSFEKVLVYAFLPTNLSSKNPMNFTARSTPSSRRLLLGDNLPVKVAHINPAIFDRNVDAALEKGHIHLWKSAITS